MCLSLLYYGMALQNYLLYWHLFQELGSLTGAKKSRVQTKALRMVAC